MRKLRTTGGLMTVAIAAAAAVTGAFGGPAAAEAAEGGARPAVRSAAPGELIVRFGKAADAQDRVGARLAAGVDFERSLGLRGLQLVRAEPGRSVATAAARLERSGDVLYAEPNFIRRLDAVPNDPFFSNLYGLHNTGQPLAGVSGTPDADIDAPEAWDLTTGSRDAVVAVIDSGVDVAHPDLRAAIWRNPGESGSGRESNGVDDDANGLVDDWRGWDWVADDNLPADEENHGTHVAGTVAASGNNATGITGVSQSSLVMPLRVLDANGGGTVADLISAYRYAGSEGAQIVNASLGGSGFSRAELDAIDAAPNTLFVVAAGNGGADGVGDNVDTAPEYPCAYQAANVLCVAASDQNDDLARFSNFGSVSVDVAAPGVRTLSTVPGGGYAYFSGTSMATPHTAGAAALIWSLEPGADVAGVKMALMGATDDKPAFTGRTVSGGRLNADRSLRLAAATEGVPLPPPPLPTPGNVSSDPDPVREAPPEEELPIPGPGPAVVLDRSAPALSLALAERRKLRTVLSRGLLLRARCSERCALRLRMIVDGRTAKRARLARSRRPVVVGRAAMVGTRRAKTVVITFTRTARIRLRRLAEVPLIVRAVAKDRAGNVRRKTLRVRVRR